MLLDRLAQLAVGQVLDLGVERQANILAILRRLGRADILDDVAAPVANDRPAARAPQQATLECQFDPLQALVVHAGETDDMGGHVAGRVEAAVFLFLMHAGEFVHRDAIGGFRRHLALDEGEGLFGCDLGIQLAHPHVQQAGQLALLLATHLPGITRNRPDGLHRRRYGQHVAVAVDDLAARGRNLDVAQVTGIALLLQEVVVDHLQIEAAADQCQEGAHQQQPDGTRTPALQRQLQNRAFGEAMTALRTTTDNHQRPPFFAATATVGGTTRPSASGATMCRRSRAIFSIRG